LAPPGSARLFSKRLRKRFGGVHDAANHFTFPAAVETLFGHADVKTAEHGAARQKNGRRDANRACDPLAARERVAFGGNVFKGAAQRRAVHKRGVGFGGQPMGRKRLLAVLVRKDCKNCEPSPTFTVTAFVEASFTTVCI
jgi:hypothetical protein